MIFCTCCKLRSCSWLPKPETSNFIKFIDSMVGSSSNWLEIGGAAPMLSPDETVNVAGFFARSAAKAVVKSAVPALAEVPSIAPWKSLSCSN